MASRDGFFFRRAEDIDMNFAVLIVGGAMAFFRAHCIKRERNYHKNRGSNEPLN